MSSHNRGTYILVIGIYLAGPAPYCPGEMGGGLSSTEMIDERGKITPFWQQEVDKWSPREVQLFLQDSPWARTEKITISIKNTEEPAKLESSPVVGAVQMMKIQSCCRTFEVPMAGSAVDSAANSGRANSLDSTGQSSPTWSFSARVLWLSSVSIRRAMIRQRELLGVPMEKAEAALAPSSDLVLALSGSFLKLLEGIAADEIKANCFLRTARGKKRKLSPTEYIPAKSDGDPIAFLIFPKTLEDKPVLSLKDGAVTFSMRGIDFNLECRFPLQPMVVHGKLDW